MKTFRQFFKEQADNKTAVIAYGRYNPPTIGHQKLIDKVGEISKRELADGYIVPSHSVDNKKNPLSFEEKKQIIEATGVPSNEIVMTATPYTPKDLLAKYNPEADKVVFLVGEKDMKEDPRFTFAPL